MNHTGRMGKLAAICMLVMLVLSAAGCGGAKTGGNDPAANSASKAEEKTYTIGICQLVQHEALDKSN